MWKIKDKEKKEKQQVIYKGKSLMLWALWRNCAGQKEVTQYTWSDERGKPISKNSRHLQIPKDINWELMGIQYWHSFQQEVESYSPSLECVWFPFHFHNLKNWDIIHIHRIQHLKVYSSEGFILFTIMYNHQSKLLISEHFFSHQKETHYLLVVTPPLPYSMPLSQLPGNHQSTFCFCGFAYSGNFIHGLMQ